MLLSERTEMDICVNVADSSVIALVVGGIIMTLAMLLIKLSQ